MMPLKADNALWYSDIKGEFPIFSETMNSKPLAFLDSASSAQKPKVVIEVMTNAMQTHYANIHRGLYAFSQQMTSEFEAVRSKVQNFINAKSEKEIIFTRNSTESINLVAHSWGNAYLNADDEIILTEMEHHANIVPWQLLQTRIGFTIKVIPVDVETGALCLDKLEQLLSPKTKLVSFVHASNVLGTLNDAKAIIQTVKNYNSNIVTFVDASQSAVHGGVDVQDLGCDFLCFTGHKLYGPTGAGVLYGKREVLADMPPYQGGGDMIASVGFGAGETTFQDAPNRFEAGTPSFIDIIGLGAAIDYVSDIGVQNIRAREIGLLETLYNALSSYEGIKISGNAGYDDLSQRAPVISFTAEWAHASDINMILDQCGVAVRTGQHCAEPLMKVLGVDATMRASLGLYNDEGDIEQFIKALDKAKMMLS
jgi:cysteine desulfurase/selenocysteine lyase